MYMYIRVSVIRKPTFAHVQKQIILTPPHMRAPNIHPEQRLSKKYQETTL